jgi:2,4-dienoyl-CoA reductase-like NADH-dependent reductase (Old Yellow Enzyme family)/thioredoxin reductase
LIQAIHAEDARVFMHLNYPSERAVTEDVPGARKKKGDWVLPLVNATSPQEVDEIVDIMAAGAGKAREVGYDGVEIQASYGDLISQFLSPLSNKRDDDLGGSLQNRARFLVRLIEKVKTGTGRDFPLVVKLVCDELVPGGLPIDDAVEVAGLVERAGADAIVANAGNKDTKYRTIPCSESAPAPFADLAARLKAAVRIPVVAIGKIKSPELADEIISQGKADFVAMARALIADPDLPRKAASGMTDGIRRCVYCLQDCAEKGVPGVGRCCTVNPLAGLEYSWKITPAPRKKRVLVVGAGPGGIQAAIIASQRGHEVELWERSDKLGGQIRLAPIAPFKDDMSEVLRHLTYSLSETRTRIRLGRDAGMSEIITFGPDVVIVATGSRPRRPSIPGHDSSLVVQARDLYEENLPVGKKIVIAGGGEIGCETADWLAGPEREITVVEVLPGVLSKMKKLPRERLLARLADKGVSVLEETEITSIEQKGVHLKVKDGEEFLLEADQVILAVGAQPEGDLLSVLKGKIKEVIAVGDAAVPGNLGATLRSATEAALAI